MKLTKRIVALLICVLMVAAMLPAGIFAEDTTGTTVSDFTVSLPFDDAGTRQTSSYFTYKAEGSGLTFSGTNVWYNYVTEEDGNVYASLNGIASAGYSFQSTEGLLNNRLIGISFRTRLNFNDATQTGKFIFPIIRSSKDGQDSTGTGNPLAVYVHNEASGTIGSFGYTTGNGTAGWTSFGYECVPNTWYDIQFVYNSATCNGAVYITDGTTSYSGTIDALDMTNLQEILMFRGYSKAYLNVDLDDLYITSNPAIDASNNFDGLQFATVEDLVQTYPSAVPTLAGFVGSGDISYYNIITGENGDKYLEYPLGSTTNAALTWTEALYKADAEKAKAGEAKQISLLNNGSFVVSFDFKHGTGNYTAERGMLSLKTAFGELRIINMGASDLFFGPGNGFKIGTLTTGEDAEWHNIKTVFIPTDGEMCYEFYIDGELAAYTTFAGGSYNFYTKASGSWVASTGLVGGYESDEMASYTDANENGQYDEGEDFETVGWAAKSSWGTYDANNKRTPIGLWDMVDNDGNMDTIASIYMFHFNKGNFFLDDLAVKSLTASDPIENAELLGYQLSDDKTAVRLIAGVDSLDFGRVGMDVEVLKNGEWVLVENSKMTDTVYTAISADDQVVIAKELGASFMYMLAINDVDSDGAIRVTPYTTKDSVRYYGNSKHYIIDFNEGTISVSYPEVRTPDYSDGLDTTGANNGYCYNAWSSYTWETLNTPLADLGWGGESGKTPSATLNADGSILINANGMAFASKNKITDADGNPITDGDGNTLYKDASFSRRVKFAYVIPTDLENYKGATFIITAKVKATELIQEVTKEVEGSDGNTYNAHYQEVVEGGLATMQFGFMTDYKTNMLAYNNYTVTDDGEWVEVSAQITITDAVLSNANMTTILDDDGVSHYSPLRPTLNFAGPGNPCLVNEFYISDLALTIIPALDAE